MKKKEIENIKQNLIKEEKTNDEKIEELDKKINLLFVNSIETKIFKICLLSALPYLICLLGINKLVKFISLPNEIIPYLPLLISLFLGYKLETIISKKQNKQEVLKNLINKKDQEKLEEETKYRIEKEKLINKNKVINKTYERILENKRILEKDLAREYIQTEDEKTEKIAKLEECIKEKENELEILTTQKYLKKNFENSITKTKRNFNISKTSISLGLITVTLCTLPSLILGLTLKAKNFFMFGLLSGGIYGISKEVKNKKVFNKINNKLNKNKITPNKKELNYTISDKKLENLIKELSTLKIILEQVKLSTPLNKNQTKKEEKQKERKINLELKKNPVIYNQKNNHKLVRTRNYNNYKN